MAKVLVIDDEQGVRTLLDTLLSRKGLEFFRHERPDVIVLDLNILEMDGIAVLQQVRSLNPDQPVVVLIEAGTPEKE
jgi:CheY-like chemotaxis protein